MSLSYRNYVLLCAFGIVIVPLAAILVFFVIPNMETVYTPQFSEAAFDALAPGMEMQKVLRELGEPFDIVDWNKEGSHRLELLTKTEVSEYLKDNPSVLVRQTWGYSKQGDSTADWYNVGVEFGPGGKLAKKFRYYVTD